jgi:hypothetical protein
VSCDEGSPRAGSGASDRGSHSSAEQHGKVATNQASAIDPKRCSPASQSAGLPTVQVDTPPQTVATDKAKQTQRATAPRARRIRSLIRNYSLAAEPAAQMSSNALNSHPAPNLPKQTSCYLAKADGRQTLPSKPECLPASALAVHWASHSEAQNGGPDASITDRNGNAMAVSTHGAGAGSCAREDAATRIAGTVEQAAHNIGVNASSLDRSLELEEGGGHTTPLATTVSQVEGVYSGTWLSGATSCTPHQRKPPDFLDSSSTGIPLFRSFIVEEPENSAVPGDGPSVTWRNVQQPVVAGTAISNHQSANPRGSRIPEGSTSLKEQSPGVLVVDKSGFAETAVAQQARLNAARAALCRISLRVCSPPAPACLSYHS